MTHTSEATPGMTSAARFIFAALGEPVPKDFNPADHFLDVISIDYRSPEQTVATKARIERIAERSQELLSDESRQMLLQLLSRRKTPEPAEGAPIA